LLQHSSLITVRGIRIFPGECEDNDVEYASLSSFTLRGLQLLYIEDHRLERSILRRVESPNLLWLRWDNFPYLRLPSWIALKNLRVLKVDGFELKSLWLDELEAPLQLRELEIYAPLQNIPESIGQLKHLERIVVTRGGESCPLLKHLPESLGDLTNLEHIDLSYCGNLERLPNSFRNLIKLKYLDLKHCYNLTFSSVTLGNISTLEYINLYHCDKIEVLPPQIAHQRSLENLNLNLRNLKEWPSAIGVPSDMEKLVLETPLLKTLPPSLGHELRKLRYLELRGCQSLKRLPDSVRLLNQLTEFTVKDCCLEELPFKTVEGESKTLSTESKGKIKWSNLDSSIHEYMLWLQQIQLFNTQILDEVSFAEGVCPTLKHLDIQDCNDLVEVGTLPNALVKLVLIGCSKLRKIKGLCGLAKLQNLDISWCEEVEELPSIETLVSLEELQVSECVKLKSIRGLEQLTKLRKLDISSCSELEDLPSVEHLRSLEELWACSCVKLKSIRGLGQLTQLRVLNVFEFSELEELRFEHLCSLEELWACSCEKLKSIKGLGQLTKLRILNVTECFELESLDGVEYLTSLEELFASECPRLQWGEEVLEQLRQRLEEGMLGI
jgi:Leucine-rich repeat (LRR) protein